MRIKKKKKMITIHSTYSRFTATSDVRYGGLSSFLSTETQMKTTKKLENVKLLLCS